MHTALPLTDHREFQFSVSRANGGVVSCVSSMGNTVVRMDRSNEQEVPLGASLLRTFLEKLSADSRVADRLPKARRDFGDALLEQEKFATLRTLRMRKGFSQKELAELIGTSQAAISEYENSKRSLSEENIRALTKALGVDFNTLMDALDNSRA